MAGTTLSIASKEKPRKAEKAKTPCFGSQSACRILAAVQCGVKARCSPREKSH